MLTVEKIKIDDRGWVLTFDCDHQEPLPIRPKPASCGLAKLDIKEVNEYRCGLTLATKRPKAGIDDGCPGGHLLCGDCKEVVSRFWAESRDAVAIRKEWRTD